MRSIIFVLGILLVVAGSAFAVCAPGVICSCTNISYPGTYTLGSSLVGAPINVPAPLNTQTACILVNSSNVNLNCLNYPITNNLVGAQGGIILLGPNGTQLTNITLNSCQNLSGYTEGIYGYNTTASRFTNNAAVNNTYGFYFHSSSNNNFTGNIAYNDTYGFYLHFNSNLNRFTGNTAYNDTDGFHIETSVNNNFTSNPAFNNSNSGYALAFSSNNTFAIDPSFNNSNDGFQIGFGSGNIFTNDPAYGNLNDGFELASSGNTFTLNPATSNIRSGFEIESGTGNVFTNNSANGNGFNGFNMYLSDGNVFTGNTADNNTNDGFELDGDNNNNTLSANTVFNNSYDGFELDVGNYNNLTRNNASSNMNDGFYIFTFSNDTFTSNTANGNVGNGFDLLSGSDYDLLTMNTANNEIGSGFYVGASSNNLLDHNNASSDLGNGFEIYGGTSNTLSNNSADNASNRGFFVYQSSVGNTLANNTAFSNHFDGILVSLSPANVINGNTVYGNRYGISLSTSSPANNASGNLAYNNSISGFVVDFGSDAANLTSNVAESNAVSGFNLSTNGNHLTGNKAYNNTQFGFFLNNSNGNIINGNMENNSPDGGYVVLSSAGNILDGNGAGGDAYCFYLINSAGNILSNNNGFACEGIFFLTNSSGNLLSGDNALYSLGGFLVIRGSNGNLITNSTSTLGEEFGFGSAESTGNLFSDISGYGNALGFIDVSGAANTTAITNSRFYNNGWEINESSVGGSQLTMVNVTLGQFQPVVISLYDNVTSGGYAINETSSPALPPQNRSSFGYGYLKVLFAPGETIDDLTFFWRPFGPSIEQGITAFTWNATGGNAWNYTLGQTMPDTSTHSLSVINLTNYTTDDIYGLFWNYSAAPSTGGAPPVSTGYLILSYSAVCPGNQLNATVSTSGSGPAAGAAVTIYENGVSVATGNTGPDGSVLLTLPKSDSYTVNATYGSYPGIGKGFNYALCGGTPACTTDDNCPVGQICQVNANPSLNQCVPLQCQCGQSVQNHTCIGSVYQCGSGSNCNACPNGEVCGDNHQCKQAGCSSDASCKDDEACKTATGAPGSTTTPGTCQPLCPDGSSSCSCGQATNHTLVPYGYECGSEPGCQQCQPGFTCNSDHKCVQGDINCPSTAIVGDQKSCAATQNGQPLSNCSVTVTDPNGKTYTESCDPSGNLQTPPLTIQGVWTVTLLQNGRAVKTVQINTLPPSVPAGQPTQNAAPGFDLGSLVWLLVLIVIIVAAILYWRSRSGKKGS